MAGIICSALSLPARAQDCSGNPAAGDSYLYADGQGDLYGYSTTYNTCSDPNIGLLANGLLYDPQSNVLDNENDAEWYNGNDATAYTAATAFYPGNYQQWGYHYYSYYGYEGWCSASPGWTYYTAYSDPPNVVPTVTNTWPTDSGGDPTWTVGGGPYSGAYEVAFIGEDLTGEIPSVTDTGCPSAYSVSAWQTADSQVWTTVTVLSSPVSACYVTFALLGWPVVVLLSPPPPPPITVTIHNGSATGPDITGSARAVTVGAYPDIFAVPSSGVPTFKWSLPAGSDTLSTPWNDQVESTSGEPAAVTALTGSELTWAFWDTNGTGQQVTAAPGPGSSFPTVGVAYNISPPAVTTLSGTEGLPNITTGCPSNLGTNAMGLCPGGGAPGVTFSYNQAADGTYELIQVVNSSTITKTPAAGQPCVLSTYGVDDVPPAASNDSPSVVLDNSYSEITANMSFSTYLMFQPQYGSWVPVSVVNWSWAGDAVNNNGTWTLKTGTPAGSLPLSGSSTGFPSWSQRANPGLQCPQ